MKVQHTASPQRPRACAVLLCAWALATAPCVYGAAFTLLPAPASAQATVEVPATPRVRPAAAGSHLASSHLAVAEAVSPEVAAPETAVPETAAPENTSPGDAAPNPAAAEAPPTAPGPLPTLAELEALGARIGVIHVTVNSIFDLNDPEENWAPFRWANRLHVTTRPAVIRSGLLFQSGDRLETRRLDEAERVLRRSRYLYDVQIRPVAWHPDTGLVDLEVRTRDTWTLAPGISASRSGGSGAKSLSLRELNVLGSGIAFEIDHERTVDRSGTEYSLATDRALGTWIAASLSTRRNDDGQRDVLKLARPFYALETPWAAGLTVIRDERVDALYQGGRIQSQYQRTDNDIEIFGGRATPLAPGWVRRTSLGVFQHEDRYAPVPGRQPPRVLPPDDNLIGPFARVEWLEDRFEKTINLDQMGRTEYVPLGLHATVQLGRGWPAWGASRDVWLYQGQIRRGFELSQRHIVLTSAALSGRWADGATERQRASGQVQYYHPVNHAALSYLSISADALTRPGPLDHLLLGGDSGLRGYPLRYQSGDRRVLITMEQRLYTDWYWLKLFRVGGAAFFDVGRAWGGEHINPQDPGWLANVGVGLRIFSVRAAFGTVLHLDFAMPINPEDGIKKTQFLIKTKTSF